MQHGKEADMNVIVITGASSGIGREFALQLDEHFTNIDEFWLVARNRGELKKLGESLRHRARIFPVDLTDKTKRDALENAAFRHDAAVRMLINCAGYGIMGSFCEQDGELEAGMIRLNCEALTDITHRMIPYMRPGSRIIQMASSAAFLPQPDFAVYAATKSYVLSFSAQVLLTRRFSRLRRRLALLCQLKNIPWSALKGSYIRL